MPYCKENEILSKEFIESVEQFAIQKGKVTHRELIESAAYGLATEIINRFSNQKDIVICCGGGHNGADGYACADFLSDFGYQIQIISIVPKEKMKPDTAFFAQKIQKKGIPIHNHENNHENNNIKTNIIALLHQADIIIDALFGIGLNRPITTNHVSMLIKEINASRGIKVAVDIPSGLQASGMPPKNNYVVANHTFTFFRLKFAHCLQATAIHCGNITHVPLPPLERALDTFSKEELSQIHQNAKHTSKINEPQSCFDNNKDTLYQSPKQNLHSYKYNRASVLCFAGAKFPGAAILSTKAAFACNASYLHLKTSKQAFPFCLNLVPNNCVVSQTNKKIHFFTHKNQNIPQVTSKFQAILAGPGSGRTKETRTLTLHALASNLPVVLDADAISAFTKQREMLILAINKSKCCVLTPHEGEFQSLFPHLINYNKIQKAHLAAQETGAIIVLKGADTVIASSGKIIVNYKPNPYLASAGTGDVLAGMIVALLAQGMPALEASCAAVKLHTKSAEQTDPFTIEAFIKQIQKNIQKECAQ